MPPSPLLTRVHCLTLFSFSNDNAAETAKTPPPNAMLFSNDSRWDWFLNLLHARDQTRRMRRLPLGANQRQYGSLPGLTRQIFLQRRWMRRSAPYALT